MRIVIEVPESPGGIGSREFAVDVMAHVAEALSLQNASGRWEDKHGVSSPTLRMTLDPIAPVETVEATESDVEAAFAAFLHSYRTAGGAEMRLEHRKGMGGGRVVATFVWDDM